MPDAFDDETDSRGSVSRGRGFGSIRLGSAPGTDARERLAPGGRLYLVGLTGMRKFVQRVMQEHFGNYEKLKQGPDYAVALAVA